MVANQARKSQSIVLSNLCLEITEHAPAPMATVDLTTGHVVRYVNPAFCRLMDKTSEQLVGRSLAEMLPENDECLAVVDRICVTGKSETYTEQQDSKPHIVFWSYAMWPVLENQRPVAVMIQVTETATFHEAKVAMNEALILGSVRQHELAEAAEQSNSRLMMEVTAHRKTTVELAEKASMLEHANEELESFGYSVSHDLQAPLRHICGFSDALLTDFAGKLDATGQDYLRRIHSASLRMGNLIDALLNLSKVTRATIAREKTDLSSLARDIAEELGAMSPDRVVELVIAEGLTANVDPGLLRIVLNNLLQNAWKFTARRSNPRIEFGCSPRNGKDASFFVRDNGAGFDMTYADNLFGAFQRLHYPSEFPGTGIGLATVQRIIQRHGGTVWAESVVDAGATFFFKL